MPQSPSSELRAQSNDPGTVAGGIGTDSGRRYNLGQEKSAYAGLCRGRALDLRPFYFGLTAMAPGALHLANLPLASLQTWRATGAGHFVNLPLASLHGAAKATPVLMAKITRAVLRVLIIDSLQLEISWREVDLDSKPGPRQVGVALTVAAGGGGTIPLPIRGTELRRPIGRRSTDDQVGHEGRWFRF